MEYKYLVYLVLLEIFFFDLLKLIFINNTNPNGIYYIITLWLTKESDQIILMIFVYLQQIITVISYKF